MWRPILDSAAELILGAQCAGCRRPGFGPCPSCQELLRSRAPFLVTELSAGTSPVLASGAYQGELRNLLLAAKERQALGLLPLLGERLAVAVAAGVLANGCPGSVLLVPVPTAPAHVAARGVDLTRALARIAARQLGAAGLTAGVWSGLRLRQRRADQGELGQAQRLRNLVGAFRARAVPSRGEVVVIDDIVTTGATLVEAERALNQAGAGVFASAVVAATPRRRALRPRNDEGAPD